MSLEDKWIKAKKAYDADAAKVEKVIAKLTKERDTLRKAAEKQHKKLKIKEKLDSLINDRVQARMSGQDLIKLIEPLKAKNLEIKAIIAPQKRKTISAQPAFREVDKVLAVGIKLARANVTDPKK